MKQIKYWALAAIGFMGLVIQFLLNKNRRLNSDKTELEQNLKVEKKQNENHTKNAKAKTDITNDVSQLSHDELLKWLREQDKVRDD